MNHTYPPTIAPIYLKNMDGGIFIIIGFVIFTLIFFGIVKLAYNNCITERLTQVVVIELPEIVIPVAVSILDQSVDNEHIGTVV